MIAKDNKDIEKLKEIGSIVARVRDSLAKRVKVGITTKSLDDYAKELFLEYGAVSAPISMYDFPGQTNISINEVVAHGIPNDYVIQDGDKVNIDVSPSKDGYFCDTAITVIAGKSNLILDDMIEVSKKALYAGIDAAKVGSSTANIGKNIYKVATQNNYTVIRNLTGHGVGKSLHEEPHYIFNYNEREGASLLNEGQVIAIETFISDEDEWIEDEMEEGEWELFTENKSMVIQFEHTIIVSKNGNIILTKTEDSLF